MSKSKTKSAPKISSRTKQAIVALPPKKQKYVLGRLEGKSKKVAALDAGYSPSVALTAAANIEDTKTLSVLQEALSAIPVEKIVNRIAEGLDAEKTEFAKFEGEITDQKNCVDFEQRGRYIDRWTELMGYKKSATDAVFNNNGPTQFIIDL